MASLSNNLFVEIIPVILSIPNRFGSLNMELVDNEYEIGLFIPLSPSIALTKVVKGGMLKTTVHYR